MSGPVVSFIVPTLDRPEELARFLDSVATQRRADCEVIVVDQGEASVESLARRYPGTTYLRSAERGLSRNRNLGLRSAAGSAVVFADDDCVLDGGYYAALQDGLPRLRAASAFGYGEVVTLEDGSPFVPTFRPHTWYLDSLCSVGLVFPREILDRAGGFDERFGVGAPCPAGEETDLLLRLVAAGVTGLYIRDLRVRHPRRARSPELVSRYRRFGYGHGALARKHVGNRLFLVRFCYGLARTLAGLALTGLLRRPAAPLYRASVAGKLHGFLDFPNIERGTGDRSPAPEAGARG